MAAMTAREVGVVLFVVFGNFTVYMGLINVTKFIFHAEKFKYPMFVTMFGCIFSCFQAFIQLFVVRSVRMVEPSSNP